MTKRELKKIVKEIVAEAKEEKNKVELTKLQEISQEYELEIGRASCRERV